MPLSDRDASSLELLFVDLDGTLTTSDSLMESLVALVRARPSVVLRLPLWLVRGKSSFKSRVANANALDPALLQYREELLIHLQEYRSRGVEVVLATAANQDLARGVADHLGLFDFVLSSDEHTNMRGHEKLLAIQRHAQGRRYGYVGNARIDVPILEAADAAFIAGPRSDEIRKRLSEGKPVRIYTESRRRPADLVRLMRPRQWLKNSLLFIPLITSQQQFEASSLAKAAIGFAAFSLTAAGSYVINDVLDVHADRRHATKSRRPVAAGIISIPTALIFATALLGSGAAIAAFLPTGFQLTLAGYLGVSLAYTLVLKSLLLLDVVTLAAVFVLRVVAGAEAIDVTTSFWLLGFSSFFFASLALTKRCSELRNLQAADGTVSHGRAYRTEDLAVLQIIGVATGVVSVLVMALYIQDPTSAALYSRPEVLWLLTPLLLYWISRVWVKVGRGEMSEDPLLFSITDPASWGVMVISLVVILVAR